MASKFSPLSRALNTLEFYWVCLAGGIFGISWVIGYLRNPNPLISVRVMRYFGASIGEKATIKRSLFLDNVYEDENSKNDFSNIEIGKNCYIGDCVYFDLSNKVTLQDNVVVSGRVSFITHADCNRSKVLSKSFPRKCLSIEVGCGTWIGFSSIVLAGTWIGENSVLASNSLACKSLEGETLYAGSPAKKKKVIEFYQE